MKLWKCSICHKVSFWSPTHQAFSSFLVDEEYPSFRVIACSKDCQTKAEAGHANGTIELPKIQMGGYTTRLIRNHKGYNPQPDQKTLIRIWNKEHAEMPINEAFSR